MEHEQRPGRPRRKVYVVLPVFNEADRIETLLDRIDETLDQAAMAYQVLLIDDGSYDGTTEIVNRCARRFPIQVRRHDVRCHAIDFFDLSCALPQLTLAAGGQHDVETVAGKGPRKGPANSRRRTRYKGRAAASFFGHGIGHGRARDLRFSARL